MGARAQYVVVEDGAWQRYYSHWAANRVVEDLLPGPAAATRCFRANRGTEEWLDDVWCEGAALVDHDRHVLLWFCFRDSWADQVAVRAVLARTWPGWDVRFAHDGIGDLTHHLGLGRDLTRAPRRSEPREPFWFADDEDTEPWTVVSLRLPDGRVRAWGAGSLEIIANLNGGPGPADGPAETPGRPRLTDMPYAGIHLEHSTRTVSVWAVTEVPGLQDWPLPGWEGWTLDFRGDDHSGQAAVLPPEFPFPQVPLAPALRRLRDGLGAPPADTGALLARALAAPGPDGTTVAVNPAAPVPHTPADPTAPELAALRDALDNLLTQAEVGGLTVREARRPIA